MRLRTKVKYPVSTNIKNFIENIFPCRVKHLVLLPKQKSIAIFTLTKYSPIYLDEQVFFRCFFDVFSMFFQLKKMRNTSMGISHSITAKSHKINFSFFSYWLSFLIHSAFSYQNCVLRHTFS